MMLFSEDINIDWNYDKKVKVHIMGALLSTYNFYSMTHRRINK